MIKKNIHLLFPLLFILFLFSGMLFSPLLASSFAAASQGSIEASGRDSTGNEPSPFIAQFASQQTIDGTNAVAVTFSSSLDPTQDLNRFLAIFDPHGVPGEGGWVLSKDPQVAYFANIEADTAYAIEVHKGLKSADGTLLNDSAEFEVKTRPVEAMIHFGSKGFILSSRLSRGLPVHSVNIDQADIDFFRIKPTATAEFINEFSRRSYIEYYNSKDLNRLADLVYSGRWDLEIQKDLRSEVNIPITHIEPLKMPGVYVAVLKGAGVYDYQYSSTWFTISDLGMHVRKYPNALQIQVQSLASAEPISGTVVEAFDRNGFLISRVKSDAEGVARLQGDLANLTYLIARNGEHITLLPMDLPAMDLSEFRAVTELLRPVDFFVYGPRDLYRPGERVVIDGLLRKHDGIMTAGLPIKFQVFRPDGRMIHEALFTSRHLNYYHRTYTLPADAPTGRWRMEFTHAGQTLKPYLFTVAEFLPERMKLSLDSPHGQGDRIGRADSLTVAVQGDYLYGAPASNSKVDARVRVRPARDLFPDAWPGYEFGRITDSFYETFQIDAIRLDENGKGRLTIESRWNEVASPAWVSADVSLYESGGRPVARSRSWQVWPADRLVGIRSLSGENGDGMDGEGRDGKDGVVQVKSDAMAEFEVICVDKEGSLTAASNLQAVVIREHRDYYWEFRNGSWQWGYTRQFYPVERFTIDVAEGAPSRIQVPVSWGGYRLEVTHPGTGLVTSYRIWAGWRYTAGGWSQGSDSGSHRPDRVDLSLDKPAYGPGETARVMVKAPEGGKGYLFVEADTNLLTLPVTVPPEGKTVEIEIDPSWQRHDLYISALIVRPGEGRIEALPKRSVGLIHLPLDRTKRRLFLEIGVPDKIEPDQSFDVPVMVRNNAISRDLFHDPSRDEENSNGRTNGQNVNRNQTMPPSTSQNIPHEAWVTLAVVDVGVLNLTDFKTPDPWNHFFQPRRYGVEMHDLYQRLIEPGKGAWARQRFGGDAPRLSRGGDRPESDVRILAIHQQAIPVDGDGMAYFRLTLPDFNGAVRFMAVAHTADAFGSAEKEVTVAAPLVVQISMPRFLSMGDRSMLMVDLHNLSGMDQSVDVRLETGSPVRAVGETQYPVTLRVGEKKSLTLPVLAEQKIGRAPIVCTIDGLMTDDGMKRKMVKQWFLETRPPWPAATLTWRRALKPGETFTTIDGLKRAASSKTGISLKKSADSVGSVISTGVVGSTGSNNSVGLLKNLIADTVTVEVTMDSRPAINVADHVKYLNAYPYGCLEQITSGIYPHVLMGRADFAALGITSGSDRERMEKVSLGIQRLLEKQKATGGFGLWQADSPEDFWLTAYVSDFLINAREAGYVVPVDALSKALDRLLRYVRRSGTVTSQYGGDDDHYPAAVRAYAAMVLSRVQSLTLGDARSLYGSIKEDLKGPLGLFQAGIALYLAGDAALASEAFDKAMGLEREGRLYYGDYGSQLRDVAFSSYLLQTHCPDFSHRYVGKLSLQLNRSLETRRWLSTQERNALVMAGLSTLRGKGEPWRATVTTGTGSGTGGSLPTASGANPSNISGSEPWVLTGDRMRSVTHFGVNAAEGVGITNVGDGTLFIDVAMNGYPSQKPDPVSDGVTIERRYLSMGGAELPESLFHLAVGGETLSTQSFNAKSDLQNGEEKGDGPDHLKSGRRMIVELRFRAEERLSNALVVDLLPAGLELEDPSLAGSSVIDDVVVDGKSIATWHESLSLRHNAYRDDRFVAAVHMEKETTYRLFYPVRVVTPGEFLVPPPLIEDMYRPYIRGIGDAVPLMPVMNR